MTFRIPFFRLLCAACAGWLLVLTCWRTDTLPQGIGYHHGSGIDLSSTNSTLGFQRIFAISLPQRTDRQDSLALLSVLSGLEIDIAPGVRGEDVLEKTIPKIPKSDMGGGGFVGSWRAHLNVMKRIVEEKIATALILEDDVDWDVNVREQMARVVNALAGDQTKLAEDWDVMWLGDVGERLPKDDTRKIVVHDPSVPSHENLSPGFQAVKAFPEHSRIIHPTDFPLCTYGYAVSYAGAQKVLYHASLDRVVSNFDTDLANNCWLYMNCISVTPPLFHFDRNKGMERDSDTDQAFVKHNREPGNYKNIENSVRIRMKEKFGEQRRKDRIWRDVSEFGPYFVEAIDLPGQ